MSEAPHLLYGDGVSIVGIQQLTEHSTRCTLQCMAKCTVTDSRLGLSRCKRTWYAMSHVCDRVLRAVLMHEHASPDMGQASYDFNAQPK